MGSTHGTFTLACLEIADVGRGAGLALVLRTPEGRTYLYDTGSGYPDGDGWVGDYNAGRDTVLPYLESVGVREVDGVLVSHAHYDHFGGLLWLANHVEIGRLYDSGYVYGGPLPPAWAQELGDYERLRARFAQAGRYEEAHSGDRLGLDAHLDVDVLAPPKEYFGDPRPDRRAAADPPAHYLLNANSLGVRIQHGDVVFLLPGDIQHEDQVCSLLPSVPADDLRCHILVAPGHGIHAAPEFAAATRPEVTIASVERWRHDRGIPAPKVFGDVGSRVLVTGLDGHVTVRSDGTSYAVEVAGE